VFRRLRKSSAKTRASTSVTPPAENPTTILIGGISCETADELIKANPNAAAAIFLRLMTFPFDNLISWPVNGLF
jgi:hypothetical protein